MNTNDILKILYIVFFALAALNFVISIILFFKFRIVEVIQDLNGTLAKKQIEQMRARNENTKNYGALLDANMERTGSMGATGSVGKTGRVSGQMGATGSVGKTGRVSGQMGATGSVGKTGRVSGQMGATGSVGKTGRVGVTGNVAQNGRMTGNTSATGNPNASGGAGKTEPLADVVVGSLQDQLVMGNNEENATTVLQANHVIHKDFVMLKSIVYVNTSEVI